MIQTSTRRRTGAGVAVGALVTSALLFTPSAQAATTTTDVRESQIAKTASADGWYITAGDAKVANEGLQLTGGAQLIKGNAASTTSTLDDVGTATVAATPADAAPFRAQLTDDSIADGPATLRETAADVWQSDKQIGTIAPDTNATLAEIGAVVGTDYKITGFGVASTGTAVVSQIEFDDTAYKFANSAPVAKDRSISTKLNTAVSVPLTATDVDGNALTYTISSVVGGSVTGSGATQTFTPAKDFKGSASVKYTVDDARGGVATGTVTIQVQKLTGKVEIYRIHPAGKVSVRNTVKLYATVKVDGKSAPRGTTVYGYAKGKKVITAKVNSSGKVKLTLPNKLPAGKATLKVAQVGSSKLNADSDSIVVRVKK
jgi:hypothetical protein|nr:hypothetical protein [Aeromicrobium sp.]